MYNCIEMYNKVYAQEVIWSLAPTPKATSCAKSHDVNNFDCIPQQVSSSYLFISLNITHVTIRNTVLSPHLQTSFFPAFLFFF